MFNVDSDSATKSFEEIWANQELVKLDMDDNESSVGVHSGGSHSISKSTIKLQVFIESGTAWEIHFLDLDKVALCFCLAIPVLKLDKINPKAYKLHCVLGGHIAFINMVAGFQGCSASYPCYLCEVLLATLKKHEISMTVGQRRTWERGKAQIKAVLFQKTAKGQKRKLR
jgi:hypothetical protein